MLADETNENLLSKDPTLEKSEKALGRNPDAIPPPLAKALEGVKDPEAKAILSIALSRTSLGVGPDPETAKILAKAEMHEEECRLKAFQSNLENREKQGERDHEFRKKRLNHSTSMSVALIATSIVGIGAGFYFTANGNSTVSTPVMVAGFSILTPFAGKLLSSRDKD